MTSDSPARVADAKFFVLVGIDGSGKTTLLSEFSVPGVVTASWRELRSHDVPATLAPDAPTKIKNRLSPLSRAMFIGGHLVAQYEYLVRPRLDGGLHVLLDSYYFKLLAKEQLFGTVHPEFESLCRELPPPHGVIYVEVEPEISFNRKQGMLSPYEYDGAPTEESYINFQTRLAKAIKAQISSIPCVTLDGTSSADELLTSAEAAVKELLAISQGGYR